MVVVGFELLIFEITGSVHDYPVPHKKMSCLFLSLPTYVLNIMVSTTQTLNIMVSTTQTLNIMVSTTQTLNIMVSTTHTLSQITSID